MNTTREAFVAVRLVSDADYEWLDVATASGCREVAQAEANATNDRIPQWAKANPVVRIAKVTITEVTR